MPNVQQNNVTIKKLVLHSGTASIDVSLMFLNMTIYEDIYTNAISGHITIPDARSIIEVLPILGEETLEVEYTTFANAKAHQIVSYTFDVTKLEDYFPEDDNSVHTYTLHFQSPIMNLNLKTRIDRAYGTDLKQVLATSIVDDVFSSYLNTKAYTVDASDTYKHLVCASWTPFQTLNYIAETTKPASSLGLNDVNCSYMFFEDAHSVKFVSLSSLIEGKLYKESDLSITSLVLVNDAARKDKEGSSTTIVNQVLEWQVASMFSNNDSTRSGMFSSTAYYYDTISRTVNVINYDYTTEFKKQSHIDTDSAELLSSRSKGLVETKYMYNSVYNQNNVLPTMKSKLKQLDNNVIVATVNGCSGYRLGQLLTFNIPSTRITKNTRDNIKFLSGEFLLSRIKSTLTQNLITTDLELRKGCRRNVL